jgi:hypothetical protein
VALLVPVLLFPWRGGGSAADTSGAPVRVCLIQDSSDISVSSATIE